MRKTMLLFLAASAVMWLAAGAGSSTTTATVAPTPSTGSTATQEGLDRPMIVLIVCMVLLAVVVIGVVVWYVSYRMAIQHQEEIDTVAQLVAGAKVADTLAARGQRRGSYGPRSRNTASVQQQPPPPPPPAYQQQFAPPPRYPSAQRLEIRHPPQDMRVPAPPMSPHPDDQELYYAPRQQRANSFDIGPPQQPEPPSGVRRNSYVTPRVERTDLPALPPMHQPSFSPAEPQYYASPPHDLPTMRDSPPSRAGRQQATPQVYQAEPRGGPAPVYQPEPRPPTDEPPRAMRQLPPLPPLNRPQPRVMTSDDEDDDDGSQLRRPSYAGEGGGAPESDGVAALLAGRLPGFNRGGGPPQSLV